MTVQPAIEMWSRTRAEISSDDGITRRGSITKGYQVIKGDNDDVSLTFDADDLPQVGSSYSAAIPYLTVRRKPLVQQVSPTLVLFAITWEGKFGPGGIDDPPWNNPPEYDWEEQITDEPIDQDRFGKPFATVNGEPVKGLTEKVPDFVCNITRNYQAVNAANLHAYLWSVNSNTVQTNIGSFLPGVARLMSFRPKEIKRKNDQGQFVTAYFTVRAKVAFRYPYRTTAALAWAKRYRHEGFKEKKNGRIIHALDGNNDKVSRPVLLKTDGTREADPTNAVWSTDDNSGLARETLTPLDYSLLGLF